MTTIVDYGAGNLRSVENTLDHLGATYSVTNRPEEVRRAGRIILPGVGHFGQMMRAIDGLVLRAALLERIRAGAPFLGICIGLQCLFEGSEEAPGSKGLGLFAGCVRRFVGQERIPHMGWNSLERVRPSRLLGEVPDGTFTYFAHSYYAPLGDFTAATCTYNVRYTAVLERDNVFGVQFHPEKSGALGLAIVRNFVNL